MKKSLFVLYVMIIGLLSGCSHTQVKKIDTTHYILTHPYNDPPGNLSSRALSSKADALCPSGYHIQSKNAGKKAELGISDEQCAAYKHCDYVLEWRIHCVEQPKEAFSIFGKH